MVRLTRLVPVFLLGAFEGWLHCPDSWFGGFDLPFGLPRKLVEQQGWPTQWDACIRHYAPLDRASIRTQSSAYCAARPAGVKFAHRATDRVAHSSPSMKWVNPPLAFMVHAGVPLFFGCWYLYGGLAWWLPLGY